MIVYLSRDFRFFVYLVEREILREKVKSHKKKINSILGLRECHITGPMSLLVTMHVLCRRPSINCL